MCLDCGYRRYYSSQLMRPLRAREVRRMLAARAGDANVLPFSMRMRRLIPGRTRNTAA